jgi:hypothetical protein
MNSTKLVIRAPLFEAEHSSSLIVIEFESTETSNGLLQGFEGASAAKMYLV